MAQTVIMEGSLPSFFLTFRRMSFRSVPVSLMPIMRPLAKGLKRANEGFAISEQRSFRGDQNTNRNCQKTRAINEPSALLPGKQKLCCFSVLLRLCLLVPCAHFLSVPVNSSAPPRLSPSFSFSVSKEILVSLCLCPPVAEPVGPLFLCSPSLCPSVRPSVRQSACPSLLSVRLSVCVFVR